MGGCRLLPRSCAPSDKHDPTDQENENAEVVEGFISNVWGHQWDDDDDYYFTPPEIRTALEASLAVDYIRGRPAPRRNEERARPASELLIGRGRFGLAACVKRVHETFEDFEIGIEDLIAKGDLVLATFVMKGKERQRDDANPAATGLLDRPDPTGRSFRTVASAVFRLENSKIVESWTISDEEGMREQIAMP